jgi:hypothetical protein
MICAWRGDNHMGHLPAQLSVRMAIRRSTEPRMARWMMIGRAFSPSSYKHIHAHTPGTCMQVNTNTHKNPPTRWSLHPQRTIFSAPALYSRSKRCGS